MVEVKQLMHVVVAVPYRETPERKPWFEAVKRHYSKHFPEWKLVTVDSGHESFHRAATRNLAVREAEKLSADVVIINDADTLARSASIRAAVDGAFKGGLHYPFEGCAVYTGARAQGFVSNVVFPETPAFASTGGIYVVRPDQWWAIGGADEEFTGWGGEDDATYAAADALIGVHRHPGTAVSLGHSAERLANPHYADNMARARAYQAADTAEEMRAVIDRRSRLLEDVKARRNVAVVVPSRGRPDNLTRLRDAIRQTQLTQVTILAGLDEDDAPTYPRLPDVEYTVRPRQRLNAWWNELALANLDRFDTFVFLGDDNVPVTPGWDFLLDDELRLHNDTGFATGPDGLRKDKRFTWAAISARQIKAIGYVGPASLTHLYIDNSWQSLATATGTMYWLDHVHIDHLHYSRKGAGVENDETYQQANSREINAADKAAWQAWERSTAFTEAVAAIRDLSAHPRPARPTVPVQTVTVPYELRVGGETARKGTVDVPVRIELTGGTLTVVTDGDLADLVIASMQEEAR